MSFYLRALRHGVLRLFTLPRLSLPILITLYAGSRVGCGRNE